MLCPVETGSVSFVNLRRLLTTANRKKISLPLTELRLIDVREEIHLISKVTLPDAPFMNLSLTGAKISQTEKTKPMARVYLMKLFFFKQILITQMS